MEQGAFLGLTCRLGLQSPRLICCEFLCLGWIANSDSCHSFAAAICDDMWTGKNRSCPWLWEQLSWWGPSGGFAAGDSASAGVQCVYTLSVVTVVGLGSVSGEDGVWGGADYVCERGTEPPLQFHLIVSHPLASALKMTVLNNPSSWLSRPLSVLCWAWQILQPHVSREEAYHSRALGEKAIEMQRGRVGTWKGYPVETGARLHENASISMRVHL